MQVQTVQRQVALPPLPLDDGAFEGADAKATGSSTSGAFESAEASATGSSSKGAFDGATGAVVGMSIPSRSGPSTFEWLLVGGVITMGAYLVYKEFFAKKK